MQIPSFHLARGGFVREPLKTACMAVVGAAVITIGAKIQIPFWPVPMTLHTLAIFGLAVLCGPRVAVSAFLIYLAEGALGWPVFSGSPERGIGITYMVGPTGGYLIGYLIASGLVAILSCRRGVIGQFCIMVAGLVLVYAMGVAWLAFFVPAQKLLALGVLPFLAGDLIKIGIIALSTHLLAKACMLKVLS